MTTFAIYLLLGKPSTSIYTRALIVIWCFVVLILTQSYTATLTSMLTVQELRPTVRHMDELRKSGANIGYQKGSFTLEKLKQERFDESKLKIYNSPEEMRELFLKTSSNGGIDAAFDEVPYVNLFMTKYCKEYTIIEPRYKADGFGFVSKESISLFLVIRVLEMLLTLHVFFFWGGEGFSVGISVGARYFKTDLELNRGREHESY